MNNDFELSSWELEQLKRLPLKHQQFAKRYPVAISNVIDRLDSPPLPFGYQSKWIDFYYFDEAEEPHVTFVGGELKYIDLPENIAKSRLIHVQIDGSAAYIEIEGEIVLNRLGGIKYLALADGSPPAQAAQVKMNLPFVLMRLVKIRATGF